MTVPLHAVFQPGAMPLTAFIGRDQEIATVAALLVRPEVGLLTLTGPGGIGKTRLALQISAQLDELFADGIAVVSLAPIHDPELVLPTIAQALNVPDAVERALLDRITSFLAERQLLLVLDNLEHLLDTAALLIAQFLTTCPELTVLATSRTRLGISGEQVVPVAPVDPGTARALFTQRAQAADSGFHVTTENAAVVDAICDRLDRLPLAIELAAARTNVLPLKALLTRLDQRLDLLIGGPRDAPARQRTMRHTIAWSHDLLDPPEQVLYFRLGVFIGGFTLEAARAVTGAEHDVLAGVSALVAASLVNPAENAGEEPRFTMLETIRQDARERLEASGQSPATHRALLQHLITLAERHWVAPSGYEWEHWLRRLGQEAGNIRAALAWALDQDPVSAAHLAGTLTDYWIFSSELIEGRAWIERALATAPDLPLTVQTRALLTAGWLAKEQCDVAPAEIYLTEAASTARAVADERAVFYALMLLGEVLLECGEVERASVILKEMGDIAAANGEPLVTAIAMVIQGRLAIGMCDLPGAQAYFERAVVAHRTSGGTLGVSIAQLYLGENLLDRGDATGAATQFGYALRGFLDFAAWDQVRHALLGFAAATVHRDPGRAIRILGAAEVLLERVASPSHPPDVRDRNQTMDQARTALGEAGYTAAWEAGRMLTWDEVLAEVATLTAPIPSPDTPPAGLTPRELEILRLLAEGYSNRAMADQFSLSERTVENHVHHILDKLGLESRVAAATWAVRHGLA